MSPMKESLVTPREPPVETSSALFKVLRVFGFVALALMFSAIVYAGWIAIENWGSIRV